MNNPVSIRSLTGLFIDVMFESQTQQIFLHIPIGDSVFKHHILTPVQHIFSCNRAEAVSGHFTFLLVDQVAVLLGDGLGAVLDLVDLAGTGGRVEHYHVELSNGELQDENLFLGVGQLGFQQDDILHHPALDLVANTLRDEIAFHQREVAEGFVQKEALNQGIGLGIAQTGLGDDCPHADVIHRRQASHLDIAGQIQKVQIFLDLSRRRKYPTAVQHHTLSSDICRQYR